MSLNRDPSAMRRKAGLGRPPPEIGQLTPARALRAAVVQAAQEVAELAVVAGSVEESRLTLDALTQALPPHPLIGLVEGAEGRFGLVVLDPQAVAALIEIQTTGRVVPRPAEPRPPTRTDAIMCADFIDRTLEIVEARLVEAGGPGAPAFSGFRYAMALADERAIAITLDDMPYRIMKLPLDFVQGAKLGEILLALPFYPPGQGMRGGDGGRFTEAMRARVLNAQACLSAVLARHSMTLAQVARLEVGSVIALPREALARVEIADLQGRVVAHGRLGQADGHRALRLLGPDEAPGSSPKTLPVPSQPRLAAPEGEPASSSPGHAGAGDEGGGFDAGIAGGNGAAASAGLAEFAGLDAILEGDGLT